jgi:molecular chaperone HscB
MQIDFSKNHFELFQLPVAFELDPRSLEKAYRDLQREVHPDRYVNATPAEQRLAAQWATQANEAYRTLKSPLNRGRYFLKIHGIDTEEESNTSMPLEFLMQQMEWREAVVDAKARKDEPALDVLSRRKRDEESALLACLGQQLAEAACRPDARETVRKLRFLEKLGEEINIASESING